MSEERYKTDLEPFTVFSAPMLHQEVSHIWRGHGSAIFLELGKLIPRTRQNGTPSNPQGEMGLMIEWSWRIEDQNNILGGSWSDEKVWPDLFSRLLGTRVTGLSLFARLPEVQVEFSNGLYLCSMMTADGNPEWALFDRRDGQIRSVGVKEGELHFENADVLNGDSAI